MTESRFRILRIIARLNVGGPSIQAINLSGLLPKERYGTMLVSGTISAHEGDMAYLAAEMGVRPVTLFELGREISLLNDLKGFMALRKIIKCFKPHIIHTHTAKAGTLGRLAALSVNLFLRPADRIKIVHTFHGHVFHSYFTRVKTLFFINIERILARFTDKIIVLSFSQKNDICRRFRVAEEKKVSVVPLGFGLAKFRKRDKTRTILRQRFLPPGSEKVFFVGIIGRLVPVKNHRLLIEALKTLKEKTKLGLFKFLIVGDGELRQELSAQAETLGVSESVIFAGWQRDMPSVYSALDAVVLTSKNEGTPVALIEAMAASRPVVATDVGGVGDLLGERRALPSHGFELAEHGIIVPPGNAEALADALFFLLENRELCDQWVDNSLKFVFEKYSLDRLLEDIDALYRDLLDNHIT